jgi:hypothetical protein
MLKTTIFFTGQAGTDVIHRGLVVQEFLPSQTINVQKFRWY